jgi:hypothetical protein
MADPSFEFNASSLIECVLGAGADNIPRQNKDAVVFWGSQSATAEGFCKPSREGTLKYTTLVHAADKSVKAPVPSPTSV